MANVFAARRPTSKRGVEQKDQTLSPRQEQVLNVLKAGMTERQAARALGVSPHTLHSHVKAVYERLGVRSRAQLLSLWIVDERHTAAGRRGE